ncbi:MAG: hypothetical protein HYU77_01520 [Betaproteobacteria bacterium]|nr:hypothetical protein [Betaproteobacteria bacterium]
MIATLSGSFAAVADEAKPVEKPAAVKKEDAGKGDAKKEVKKKAKKAKAERKAQKEEGDATKPAESWKGEPGKK